MFHDIQVLMMLREEIFLKKQQYQSDLESETFKPLKLAKFGKIDFYDWLTFVSHLILP